MPRYHMPEIMSNRQKNSYRFYVKAEIGNYEGLSRKEFLLKNQKEKNGCGDKRPVPQTPWFLNQSRQPFKAVLQKPGIFVAPDIAGIEIKNPADRRDECPPYPLICLD